MFRRTRLSREANVHKANGHNVDVLHISIFQIKLTIALEMDYRTIYARRQVYNAKRFVIPKRLSPLLYPMVRYLW